MTTTDNTIDGELGDEIMDIFMAASGMDIGPKEYVEQILNLIAQEANKARIEILEWVLDDEYVVSYAEMKRRLAQLTAEKGKA